MEMKRSRTHKLCWAKDCGGSEKQVTDALRALEVQQGKLDLRYLDEWAARLDIVDLWRDLKSRAETP
jgi:hypothetical protein